MAHQDTTATDMAQAIEMTVAEFVGSRPAHDDLALLIVRRLLSPL